MNIKLLLHLKCHPLKLDLEKRKNVFCVAVEKWHNGWSLWKSLLIYLLMEFEMRLKISKVINGVNSVRSFSWR